MSTSYNAEDVLNMSTKFRTNVILTGQNNYAEWFREFKAVALSEGIWEYFNGATTYSVEKPKRPVPPNPENYKNKASDSPEVIQGRKAAFDEALDIYKVESITYKIDADEHNYHVRQVAKARGLLSLHVDPSMRQHLSSRETPFQWCKRLATQYKMPTARALETALNDMEKLTLFQCSSMTEYFNKIDLFRDMIKDNSSDDKSQWSDDQVIAKTLRGLTSAYESFADHYYLMRDDPAITDATLKSLRSQLLAHEAKVAEKQAYQKRNFRAKSSSPGYRSGPQRPKCSHCNKTGHDKGSCWELHPELQPRNKEKTSAFGSTKYGSGKSNRMAAIATISNKDLHAVHAGLAAHKELRNAVLGTKSCHHHNKGTSPLSSSHPTLADDRQVACLSESKGELEGSKGQGGTSFRYGHNLTYSRQLLHSTDVYNSSHFNTHIGLQHSAAIYMATNSCKTPSMSRDTWLLDSGANTYICNDAAWFSELHAFQLKINTADNAASLQVMGGGTVSLELQDTYGQPFYLDLKDVIYAPGSRCNLLSVSKLAVAGVHGRWSRKGIQLLRGSNQIGSTSVNNGLYCVHVFNTPKETTKISELVVANIDFDDPVWKWHRRLGHLSLDRMVKLLAQSSGMDLTEKQIKSKIGSICPVCATTRAIVRIPRDPARRHFKKPGDLIHIDTWGPYPIQGWDGTKYITFLTDDATRYTWEIRTDTIGDIPNQVKQTHKRIERTLGIVIKRYRGDRQFQEGPLKHWWDVKGVEVEPTAPYSHHQVGVGERVNRTIREQAGTMIQENSISGQTRKIIIEEGEELLRNSTIPEKLWPEAVSTAVHMKNRSPTRALKEKKTPWEALLGAKPNLGRERIWGSRTYTTITEEARQGNDRKLHDNRGWLGYFMGSESESVYRIWDPDKKRVRRVSATRVEEGEGVDDSQDEDNINDRVRREPNSDDSDDETCESTEDSDLQSEDNGLSEDSVQDHHSEIESDKVPSADSDQGSSSSDSNQEDNVMDQKSRFFGAVVEKRKRPFVSRSKEAKKARAIEKAKQMATDNMGQLEADSESDISGDEIKKRLHKKPFQARRDPTSRIPGTIDSRRQLYKGGKNHVADEERCQTCYDRSRNCHWESGSNKCNYCIKESHVCKPIQLADDGSLPPRKYFPKAKVEFEPIKDKCYRCFQFRLRCDSTPPFDIKCGACIKNKYRCITQDQYQLEQERKTKKKCNVCISKKRLCNLEPVCDSCIKKDMNTCTYVSANGERMVTTIREGIELTGDVRKDKTITDRYDGEDMNCVHCRRNNRTNCTATSGGDPCVYCYLSKGIETCAIWTAPRTSEKMDLSYWDLQKDEEGCEILVRNEKVVENRRQVKVNKREKKETEPQLEPDSSSAEDIERPPRSGISKLQGF